MLPELVLTMPEAGLAYDEALGFRTYRTGDGGICKAFEVE